MDAQPHPATGPITDDGKRASSANATTHGLTAKRLLCDEERERMQVIVASWTAKAFPETAAEEALVASAAIEYVRYLRCVDAEEARLKPATRDALRDWKEKRQHAVRRRGQDLKTHPEIIDEFYESAFGIDWMIRQWKMLLTLIDAGQSWAPSLIQLALSLLGRDFSPPAHHDLSDAAQLHRLAGTVYLSKPAADETPDAHHARRLEALTTLRALVVSQLDRLTTLRPTVWDEVDRPQAEAVEVASLVDTSKEGQLRHRYRRDAFRDFHRSLAELTRLRSERSKNYAREAKLPDTAGASPSLRRDLAAEAAYRRDPSPPTLRPDSRNEPVCPADPSPADRLNPHSEATLRNEASDPTFAPDQRTFERTDRRTSGRTVPPDDPSDGGPNRP